jgi:hypothetical protein
MDQTSGWPNKAEEGASSKEKTRNRTEIRRLGSHTQMKQSEDSTEPDTRDIQTAIHFPYS